MRAIMPLPMPQTATGLPVTSTMLPWMISPIRHVWWQGYASTSLSLSLPCRPASCSCYCTNSPLTQINPPSVQAVNFCLLTGSACRNMCHLSLLGWQTLPGRPSDWNLVALLSFVLLHQCISSLSCSSHLMHSICSACDACFVSSFANMTQNSWHTMAASELSISHMLMMDQHVVLERASTLPVLFQLL